MEQFIGRTVFQIQGEDQTSASLDLINEEPLSIRIQGKPYTVVMRTPGDEIAHVTGFCLGEGIVDSPDDFTNVAFCDEDVNVVTVTLNPERKKNVNDLLMRRGFISQTSCGICGKELIDDLKQFINPVELKKKIKVKSALKCLLSLNEYQPLREKSRASHGAALFSHEGVFLSAGEDVGRHNALDKAVGKVFMENRLDEAGLLVLSSRISYELVQKAARAKISVILAVSRPTALAVDLAARLDMALACLDRKNGLYVFCGDRHLVI